MAHRQPAFAVLPILILVALISACLLDTQRQLIAHIMENQTLVHTHALRAASDT